MLYFWALVVLVFCLFGGVLCGVFFFCVVFFFVYCFCAGVTLDQYTPKTWAKSHQYPEAFIWPQTSWNLSIFAGIIWQFLKNSLLINKFREVKRCACFLSAGLVYQVGFFPFLFFFPFHWGIWEKLFCMSVLYKNVVVIRPGQWALSVLVRNSDTRLGIFNFPQATEKGQRLPAKTCLLQKLRLLVCVFAFLSS